ncbi:hypothetical protein SAMN05880593_112121 [Rhizobium sp. RU36D]|nr:hypothetical protein SAMN05880593_112121 [Rhizobium sp. RU36D]
MAETGKRLKRPTPGQGRGQKVTAAKAGEQAGRRSLLRLLRLVLSAPVEVASENGADVVLTAADGTRTSHAAALLAGAVARGLLHRRDDRLEAGSEARAFLRRALAEGDPEERFQVQHREEAQVQLRHEGVLQSVRRNLTESPLGAVARLKEKSGEPFLSPEAIEAGERLAADFERGGLQPRITASWEPRLSSRAPGQATASDISDSAMAARRRVSLAIEAMGPELSGVALDVCCFAKGLETVERERQWPARSAKLMLRAALLALARHYQPPVARPNARHWGAEDFRPVLG